MSHNGMVQPCSSPVSDKLEALLTKPNRGRPRLLTRWIYRHGSRCIDGISEYSTWVGPSWFMQEIDQQ
jgi:hypothetical protein